MDLLKIIILFFVCLVFSFASALNNPYKILGVENSATTQDIRRAYLKLVKEWHPDKNNYPTAEQKFVEIKQSYELLNDAVRRRLFDQYGITNEEAKVVNHKFDHSQYGRYASEQQENLFGEYIYFDHDMSLFHKLSVTSKYFEQIISKNSFNIPYFILFYNDWCFRCSRISGTFKKLIDTLEPTGVRFATINAALEKYIVKTIGVSDVPTLVLVLKGHSYFYRESFYNVSKVVDFLRKKLPFRVKYISDANLGTFLSGWIDNKVRALVLEPRNYTRLRYLLGAFFFESKIQFGFVKTTDVQTALIQQNYKVQPHMDTLLLFKEDHQYPVASLCMSNIPPKSFKEIVASNQYLTLPRLSSQQIFEDLCPAEWSRPRKKLCVVLVTENSNAHDDARRAMRLIAQKSEYCKDRVRFAYVFKEAQTNFLNAISKGFPEEILLKIVFLWRRDASHLKYEWLDGSLFNIDGISNQLLENTVNMTRYKIEFQIKRLLRASEALNSEAFVQNLLDEEAQSILKSWISKFLYITEYLCDIIEEEHLLGIFSFIGTLGFMFIVGYTMVYFVRLEEEHLKSNDHLKIVNQSKRSTPELRLYELRAEKYNGMVRLLKPGCRTIILITDLQTRMKLIPMFHKSVWPFRKSKTLTFGHMLIEKGVLWYSELLRLSLCESTPLNINSRNCVGTVLVLNGHRKYFCVYHAKHPETNRGAKRIMRMTKTLLNSNDLESGKFVENNDSADSDSDQKILLEENLLDGLSDWLDRLFEGTTHRYFINYWPDFPTK